jgi:hypothetical protein
VKTTLKKFLKGRIDLTIADNIKCLCDAIDQKDQAYVNEDCFLEDSDGCWWYAILDDGTAINFFLDDHFDAN